MSEAEGYTYPTKYVNVDSDRTYEVSLPHSCDRWVIASGATGTACLRELDQFVAGLTALRERLARDGWPHLDDELGGFQTVAERLDDAEDGAS